MAQLVRELMTPQVVSLPGETSVHDAARRMREDDIGNVLVADGEEVRGIVTDRDLVVRGLAERADLSDAHLSQMCSEQLVTVRPQDEAGDAIARMREHAVRRVPVLDDGKAVGILSLGDAAMERDPNSALGDISSAQGNR